MLLASKRGLSLHFRTDEAQLRGSALVGDAANSTAIDPQLCQPWLQPVGRAGALPGRDTLAEPQPMLRRPTTPWAADLGKRKASGGTGLPRCDRHKSPDSPRSQCM